ncbi:MAG: hypothetical protein D6722_12770 [Bacteroidetes bacterium]|nr:MAG: hypothetical protein D6722_12770 [Bacteroidota bacterium]
MTPTITSSARPSASTRLAYASASRPTHRLPANQRRQKEFFELWDQMRARKLTSQAKGPVA